MVHRECARYSQAATVFFDDVHLRCNYSYRRGAKTLRSGASKMTSAKEFRQNAEDCLVWAKTVTSDRERAIFFDMARNWLEAASKVEGRKTTYKLRAKGRSEPSQASDTTRDKRWPTPRTALGHR